MTSYRAVGAVAVKVRPDTTGFGRETEEKLKKERDHEVKLPVIPDARLLVAKLRQTAAEASHKLAEEQIAVKLPAQIDTKGLLKDAKNRIKTINKEIKAAGIKVKIPAQLDSKAMLADLKETLRGIENGKAAKVKLKTEIDESSLKASRKRAEADDIDVKAKLDANGLARELARLGSVARVAVHADTNKLRDDLENLSRIEKIIFDPDVDFDTTEMRKEWLAAKEKLDKEAIKINMADDLTKALNRMGSIGKLMQFDNLDDVGKTLKEMQKLEEMITHPSMVIDKEAVRLQYLELKKSLEQQPIEPDVDLKFDVQGDITRALARVNNVDKLLNGKLNGGKDLLGLQTTLARMEDLENFIFDPTVQFDKEAAKEEWRKLKKELEGEDPAKLKIELAEQEKVRAELLFLTRDRYVDIVARVNKRALATAAGTLKAISGFNSLQNTGRFLENFLMNVDTYASSLVQMGLKAGIAASGFLSLGSSLIGIAGGLGQLGGYALTLPVALGSIASFLTVVITAFEGFGGAIKGNDDLLFGLTKNAQAAALALRGTWTSIQGPVQDAYWERMGTSIQDFVKQVLPELRDGLTVVASSAGGMTSMIVRAFNSLGGKQVFSGLFDNLSTSIDSASNGVADFMKGIITLASEGGKRLPQFGIWLGDIANDFGNWVNRAAESGQIVKWLDNAADSAHDLGTILKDAYGIFAAISDAAESSGSHTLDSFADSMDRVRKVVEGPTFQFGIRNLFEGANAATESAAKGISAFGAALSEISPVLEGILVISGEVLNSLLTGIGDAITRPAFQTGLANLFTGAQTGITGFLKYLPEVADGLGNIGSIVGTVFANITPVIGQFLALAGDLATQLAPSLEALAPALANLASNGVGTLAIILPGLVTVLSTFLDIFVALPGGVQTAVVALLLFYGTMKKVYAMAGVPFTPFRNLIAGAGSATGAAGRVSGAFKGMYSMIGGGVGLGVAAGFALLSSISEETTNAENSARNATSMYKDMAQAAFDAGKTISTSVEAQAAAMEGLQSRMDAGGGEGWLGSVLNNMFNTDHTQSIEQRLAAGGIGNNEIVKYMTGSGGEAAGAYLQGMYDKFESGSGNALTNALDLSGTLSANSDGAREVAAILAARVDAQKAMDDLLSTGAGRQNYTNNAIKGIIADAGGLPATISNVRDLDRLVNGSKVFKGGETILVDIGNGRTTLGIAKATEAWQIYGSEFAAAMGGDSQEAIDANAASVDSALAFVRDQLALTGKDLNKVGETDYLKPLINRLIDTGVPIQQVSTALQNLGYTSEAAGELIAHRFGDVLDNAGNTLSIFGEDIAKVSASSDGIKEFATALSEATGIDYSTLVNLAKSSDLDPTAMLANLGAMGAGLDDVKTAADAMGITGPALNAILHDIITAASQASANGVWSTQALTEFDSAMQDIRDTTDGAVSKAEALYAAIDKLRGGLRESLGIESDFKATIDDLMELLAGTPAEGDTPAVKFDFASAIDFSGLDQLNLGEEVGRTLYAQMETLGSNTYTAFDDAFDKTLASNGGDVAAALQAAMDLTSPDLTAALQPIKDFFGDNTQGYQDFLETFGLDYATMTANVINASNLATGSISNVAAVLATLPAGVKEVNIGVRDQAAIEQLESFGFQVETLPDGTSTIKLSDDPVANQAALAALQAFLVNGGLTAPVSVTTTPTSLPAMNESIRVALGLTPFSVLVNATTDTIPTSVQSVLSGGLWGIGISAATDTGALAALTSLLNGHPQTVTVNNANTTTLPGILGRFFSGIGFTANVTNANAGGLPGLIQNFLGGFGFTANVPNANVGGLPGIIQSFIGKFGFTANVQNANTGGLHGVIQGVLNNTGFSIDIKRANVLSSVFAGLRVLGIPGFADGRIIDGHLRNIKKFANGGVENHRAQIANATTMRVWAEPETGGEAYIPLSPAKRARSIEILDQVADRFGMQLLAPHQSVKQYANGSTGGSNVTTSSGDVFHIHNQYPQAEPTSRTVSRAGALAGHRRL